MSTKSDEVERALEYAFQHGVVVIAASGNYAQTSPSYPASSQFVIAVGHAEASLTSTPETPVLAKTSNKAGNKTEYFSAPGTAIMSCLHNQTYGKKSGTSIAAPYVAGVVARMLSANPHLSRTQIVDMLARSSSNYVRRSDTSPTQLSNNDALESLHPSTPGISSHNDTLGEAQTPPSVVVTALGLAGFAALCALAQAKETTWPKHGKRLVM